MLRLPDGMRDRIKTIAASNNRSMNAEIVATLEEKYPPPKDPHAERLIQLFEELMSIPAATNQPYEAKIMEEIRLLANKHPEAKTAFKKLMGQ